MKIGRTMSRALLHAALSVVAMVFAVYTLHARQRAQIQTTRQDGSPVVLNGAPAAPEELNERLKAFVAGRELDVDLFHRDIAEISRMASREQAALGSPQSPLRLRVGTSRISGRILTNGGQPLRQATVRVNATELNGSKTVTTDTDGRYEFLDLPGGRYTVNASKANYIALNYGQTRPNEISKSVELADKQHADRIDITLPRGGVLTGRVVDEYGEPVTDAQVVPMQKRLSQGQLRLMTSGRMALTNDIGEFRIFGLPPGQYYVSSTFRTAPSTSPAEAGARFGYAPTYYPSTPIPANAQAITLGLSETVSGLDLSLMSTRLATISGSVVDSRGPLHAGNVIATDGNQNTTGSNTAVIRPDGTFTMPPLPPGDYLLRATVPPSPLPAQTQSKLTAIAAAPPVVPEALVASVSVNGSDLSGVLLTPFKRITLTGRVIFDRAAGSTLRSEMIRITASPASQEAQIGLAGLGNAVVMRDFSFRYAVAAAELNLRAFVQHTDWFVKSIRMAGLDITDTGVDLRAGRDVEGIDVELTNRPQEISGTLTNDKGEALKDFSLLVFPQERERWTLDSRLIATVRSDRDGRYKLRTLPPGRYLAVPLDPSQTNAAQDPDFLEGQRNRGTPFSLAEGEAKTLDLRLAPVR